MARRGREEALREGRYVQGEGRREGGMGAVEIMLRERVRKRRWKEVL